MKLPKKFSKKITSVALCTMLLSSGIFATTSNISHAATSENTAKKLWTTTLYFQVTKKGYPLCKNNLQINVSAYADNSVKLKYVDRPYFSEFNYDLSDDYTIGFHKDLWTDYHWEIRKNEGKFMPHLRKIIDEFNSAGPKINNLMFANGFNYADTVTLPSDAVTQKNSRNDYTKGYGYRDRWECGLKLTNNKFAECTYYHQFE